MVAAVAVCRVARKRQRANRARDGWGPIVLSVVLRGVMADLLVLSKL
jgi:hypothetical protein